MLTEDELRAGLCLVLGGTSLPPSLADESDQPFPEWNARKGISGEELRKQLEDGGWTLFRDSGTITTSGFGTSTEGAVDKAIERLKKIVRSRNCNCIEIVQAHFGGVRGLRHVTLEAHSRHIQRSIRQ